MTVRDGVQLGGSATRSMSHLFQLLKKCLQIVTEKPSKKKNRKTGGESGTPPRPGPYRKVWNPDPLAQMGAPEYFRTSVDHTDSSVDNTDSSVDHTGSKEEGFREGRNRG